MCVSSPPRLIGFLSFHPNLWISSIWNRLYPLWWGVFFLFFCLRHGFPLLQLPASTDPQMGNTSDAVKPALTDKWWHLHSQHTCSKGLSKIWMRWNSFRGFRPTTPRTDFLCEEDKNTDGGTSAEKSLTSESTQSIVNVSEMVPFPPKCASAASL